MKKDLVCDECETIFHYKDWEDVPTQTCKGCERRLCFNCFPPHECSFHAAEEAVVVDKSNWNLDRVDKMTGDDK